MCVLISALCPSQWCTSLLHKYMYSISSHLKPLKLRESRILSRTLRSYKLDILNALHLKTAQKQICGLAFIHKLGIYVSRQLQI